MVQSMGVTTSGASAYGASCWRRERPLRVFEAFAGYGGATFALRRSGEPFEVVGFSEIDRFASELLAKNFPQVNNWGDIAAIAPEELPDFDLFTGGFPCQPFSSAGLQGGVEDKYGRGVLFYEIIRICEAKRPEFILLENVKGLLAKRFSSTFREILLELARIGYPGAKWVLLNSKDYGIPQNRERLWIFARRGGLPFGFSLTPPPQKLVGRLGSFLDQCPPEELYLSERQIAHLKRKHGIESFAVREPLCFDVYNKKIKHDGICITITQPEHNSLRVVEVPRPDGREVVRKMSVAEQFRLMGFEEGELDFCGQSYTQLSKRAGNGWDVNLAGQLLRHIFRQMRSLPSFD